MTAVQVVGAVCIIGGAMAGELVKAGKKRKYRFLKSGLSQTDAVSGKNFVFFKKRLAFPKEM